MCFRKKGSIIAVGGYVAYDNWIDNNGSKQSRAKIYVQEMKFLDSKPPQPQQ